MAQRWVDRDTPEWEAMWKALAAQGIHVDEPDIVSGEEWQYMGTFNERHEFRNRRYEGKLTYKHIPANELETSSC